MSYIVKGKDREELTLDLFHTIASDFSECILDIGAGDGKGSLRFARNNPSTLVVALDASFDALEETSVFSTKKQARGGTPNLVCIYGNIRDAYKEIGATADRVRVILPWGDLLEGIAEVSDEIMTSIVSCGKEDCEYEFIINAEIWNSNLPKHLAHLGEITPEFFTNNISRFNEIGLEITEFHFMEIEEINNLDTTWSRKLMSSRETAKFVKAKAVRN